MAAEQSACDGEVSQANLQTMPAMSGIDVATRQDLQQVLCEAVTAACGVTKIVPEDVQALQVQQNHSPGPQGAATLPSELVEAMYCFLHEEVGALVDRVSDRFICLTDGVESVPLPQKPGMNVNGQSRTWSMAAQDAEDTSKLHVDNIHDQLMLDIASLRKEMLELDATNRSALDNLNAGMCDLSKSCTKLQGLHEHVSQEVQALMGARLVGEDPSAQDPRRVDNFVTSLKGMWASVDSTREHQAIAAGLQKIMDDVLNFEQVGFERLGQQLEQGMRRLREEIPACVISMLSQEGRTFCVTSASPPVSCASNPMSNGTYVVDKGDAHRDREACGERLGDVQFQPSTPSVVLSGASLEHGENSDPFLNGSCSRSENESELPPKSSRTSAASAEVAVLLSEKSSHGQHPSSLRLQWRSYEPGGGAECTKLPRSQSKRSMSSSESVSPNEGVSTLIQTCKQEQSAASHLVEQFPPVVMTAVGTAPSPPKPGSHASSAASRSTSWGCTATERVIQFDCGGNNKCSQPPVGRRITWTAPAPVRVGVGQPTHLPHHGRLGAAVSNVQAVERHDAAIGMHSHALPQASAAPCNVALAWSACRKSSTTPPPPVASVQAARPSWMVPQLHAFPSCVARRVSLPSPLAQSPVPPVGPASSVQRMGEPPPRAGSRPPRRSESQLSVTSL